MKKVYLDNAATTLLDATVIESMVAVMSGFYGNPSSTHSYGKAAKTLLEKSRKNIASLIKAQAGELFFTSGGTEADNMILHGAVKDAGVTVIITSAIEHHAVLNTVLKLKETHGVTVVNVKLGEDGSVDLESLEALLQQYESQKVLVSLMHVNNEIGTILPLDKVGQLCKEYGALFHSDTVQSIHHLPIDVTTTHIDFLTASAHKFHGPKGVGFAYIRKDSGIKAFITGGEQERGLRAGTEAVHSIVGLEKAFATALENRDEVEQHIKEVKSYFISLLQEKIPGVLFNGSSGDVDASVSSILNVRFPLTPDKGKLLLFQLDLIGGIACSAGSACQSGSNQESHVLKAVLDANAIKKPSIRFSFSKYTTKEEIAYTVKVLEDFSNR